MVWWCVGIWVVSFGSCLCCSVAGYCFDVMVICDCWKIWDLVVDGGLLLDYCGRLLFTGYLLWFDCCVGFVHVVCLMLCVVISGLLIGAYLAGGFVCFNWLWLGLFVVAVVLWLVVHRCWFLVWIGFVVCVGFSVGGFDVVFEFVG